MAAQGDLLRAKVKDERMRDSFDRFVKEKKKKKRDLSLPDERRRRCEKEAKKVKLHHHIRAEHRSLQPHHKPSSQNSDKHVLHVHREHGHALSNGPKKSVQPAFPPQTPALFTFTPLKVAKARPPEVRDPHRDKEPKLKLKKENSEANVKHPEPKKKKGEFYFQTITVSLHELVGRKSRFSVKHYVLRCGPSTSTDCSSFWFSTNYF